MSTEEDAITFGLVGLGNIASVHTRAARRHSKRAEPARKFKLIGGVDTVSATAERFSERWEVPTWDSIDALLGLEPDVVFICTPNAFHLGATIQALEAGSFVFCEKPPAISADQARSMADTASRTRHRRFEEASSRLMYGLVYRHAMLPYLGRTRPERLGSVPLMRAVWVRARGVPPSGSFIDPALSGGGSGTDLGVHVADLAWWGIGCPKPLEVMALTNNELAKSTAVAGYGPYQRKLMEVEDTAIAAMRFENSILFLNASFAANVAGEIAEESVFVEWRGTRSGFIFPLHTGDRDPRTLLPEVATEEGGHLEHRRLTQPIPLTVQQAYQAQIGHVADVVLGRAQPINTPGEGVVLMNMVDGMYEAARTGRTVDLRTR